MYIFLKARNGEINHVRADIKWQTLYINFSAIFNPSELRQCLGDKSRPVMGKLNQYLAMVFCVYLETIASRRMI